ncbi:hypothetical protein [Spirosoma sp. KNUC1025]|uniref:hypothetical protein n=1 Tax=Spirosoma sp. KNUC1025 TaxID=2894082 RepID=UPI003863E540|nr:hypothetical protein LN737_15675 [Spirosoma sp. KNUC1025]
MLKRNTVYNAIVFLILLGLGAGCTNNALDPTPDDSDYFPLEAGDYWIYQVTQETYAPANAVKKTAYQLQQKITSSYTQNGQLFYLLEESIKQSELTGWQLKTIRTVYKNLKEVVSLERNVPVVKLAFPITSTTSWNINAYNANPDTVLRYQDTGKSYALKNLSFNRTVSVLGADDSTLVDQERYRRIYAQNVGLVYSENVSLDYCQATADCIGKAIIESGSKQKWELIESNRLK